MKSCWWDTKRENLILTVDLGKDWDVIVEQWPGWAVCGDILQVMHQVFLEAWLEEQVGQDKNGIDAQFLAVFGQFIDLGDGGATDLDHAGELVLAAHLHPFFGQAFAFVDLEGGAFAGGAVDQHTVDVLLPQQLSVTIDDVEVDRALPMVEWSCFNVG